MEMKETHRIHFSLLGQYLHEVKTLKKKTKLFTYLIKKFFK